MAENTLGNEIEQLEEEQFYQIDYENQPPEDIIAYNELRSCADLYRMYQKGILTIQPDFQRNFVWKGATQTRFIDSLIKQLPIPSMCFSLDYKTQRWQVIDGLQRMSTIIRFLSNEPEWTLSSLPDGDPRINGRQVKEFMDEQSDLHIFFTRVENLTIPVTVLRCDYAKESHTMYLFTIFQRLNTGGIQLNNQEIRNCIYHGDFNTFLKELDNHPQWKRINRIRDNKSYRFIHVEMILRFFTWYDWHDRYHGRLTEFLNEYMAKHLKVSETEFQQKRELFEKTVQIIDDILEDNHPQLGHSFLEAMMFGVAKNLTTLSKMNKQQLISWYHKLKTDNALSSQTLSSGIASKEKVTARLKAASAIFAGKEHA